MCCSGAWPASMVGRVPLEPDPPPWLGVRCWCVICRHGRACCVGGGPAFVVGFGCWGLVRCLSTAGVMTTPSPSPLDLGLSRPSNNAPIIPAPGPAAHAQTCISHRTELSGSVLLAVPPDCMVCTTPSVATPVRSLSLYFALPCSPMEPCGALHVWLCRSCACALSFASPVLPLEGCDMSPRIMPCPLVLVPVRLSVLVGLFMRAPPLYGGFDSVVWRCSGHCGGSAAYRSPPLTV